MEYTGEDKTYEMYNLEIEVFRKLYADDRSGELLSLFIKKLINTSKLPAYGIDDKNKLYVVTKDEYETLKKNKDIKKQITKQVVVRTCPPSSGYWYEKDRMKYLTEKLDEGYVVVMCHPIGNDLEYILEKEVNE